MYNVWIVECKSKIHGCDYLGIPFAKSFGTEKSLPK